MIPFYNHKEVFVHSLDQGPLAGLRHKTVIDYRTGAHSLALWQEEHLQGFEVPLHHHDCEEIITILSGSIEAVIETKGFELVKEQSILIPAWKNHGFKVIGDSSVKLLALFSNSNPKIFRADGTPSTPPWEGGSANHLDFNNQDRVAL